MDEEKYYSKNLEVFTGTVGDAIVASGSIGGIEATEKHLFSSMLFARICTASVSLLSLSPTIVINKATKHWDGSICLGIARSILEHVMHFNYLGIEDVEDSEWKARLKLVQLFDCSERIRLFSHIPHAEKELEGFRQIQSELRYELYENDYFSKLDPKYQRKLAKGKTASFLSREEMITRLGYERGALKYFYMLTSSNIHASPLNYYRMPDDRRGSGVKNSVDIGYTGMALEESSRLISLATEKLKNQFSHLVEFPDLEFDWELISGSETNTP
ncbi:MAG: hypothetical protein C0600_06935 [Ignavibacteria bacterium]|nr:MAG: hypothetical protein C0600_06935 [Ignavibacteria bacterium]